MSEGMTPDDGVPLSLEKLNMPPVDHIRATKMLDVALDALTGWPGGYANQGLHSNFVRLTDKAIREYSAARDALTQFLQPDPESSSWLISPYFRAIDHMENCVGASHRALLNAKSLHASGGLSSPPAVDNEVEDRLRRTRHSIEHVDERLVPNPKLGNKPVFTEGQPFMLQLTADRIVLGGDELSYTEIAEIIAALRSVP